MTVSRVFFSCLFDFLQQPRKWPELNLKSPGIKARSLSGRLPAPLHAVTSTVRLHGPPAEAPPSPELPETPPHASQITVPHVGDHSVFAPVLLGKYTPKSDTSAIFTILTFFFVLFCFVPKGPVPPPGSPSPPSLSGLSIASSNSSPQLGSPGHHIFFNSGTIGIIGSSLTGGSLSPMPTPPSPNTIPPSQQPPPLPPRSNRRRESSFSESPQQVRI